MLRSLVYSKSHPSSSYYNMCNARRKSYRFWDRPLELTENSVYRQRICQQKQFLNEVYSNISYIQYSKTNAKLDIKKPIKIPLEKENTFYDLLRDEEYFKVDSNKSIHKVIPSNYYNGSPIHIDLNRNETSEDYAQDNHQNLIDNKLVNYQDIKYPCLSKQQIKSDSTIKSYYWNNTQNNLESQIATFDIASKYPSHNIFKYSQNSVPHIFINFHLSTHICDNKSMSYDITSKEIRHKSAFSVPHFREMNSPLNLTRTRTVSTYQGFNIKGTHAIFKNIKTIYNNIKNIRIEIHDGANINIKKNKHHIFRK